MANTVVIREETKATRQHQITIPKKIWDSLELRPGLRFEFSLTQKKEMIVTPKWEDLDLSPKEWKKLVTLAHAKSNISRRFKKTEDALRYLDTL